MASTTVPFGALSVVDLHAREKFRILPSPMSVMTVRYPAPIPYTPHQTPEPHATSTISGFELDTIDEEDQDLVSTSTMARHTPASSQASSMANLAHEYVSIPELQRYLDAMTVRVERLVEENELQAEELRRFEKRRKENKSKKQRKSKEKQAKYQTDVMRELLRAVTTVMTPMPEGSPGRFVLMAVEAFVLRERVSASRS